MKLELIVAGTYEQYRDYLRESGKSPRECRYILDEHRLRGLDFSKLEVKFIGTWYNRKDAYDIERFVKYRMRSAT